MYQWTQMTRSLPPRTLQSSCDIKDGKHTGQCVITAGRIAWREEDVRGAWGTCVHVRSSGEHQGTLPPASPPPTYLLLKHRPPRLRKATFSQARMGREDDASSQWGPFSAALDEAPGGGSLDVDNVTQPRHSAVCTFILLNSRRLIHRAY